jgi:hypothetical protein
MNEKTAIDINHAKRMKHLRKAQKEINKVSDITYSLFLDPAAENIRLAILEEENIYRKKVLLYTKDTANDQPAG